MKEYEALTCSEFLVLWQLVSTFEVDKLIYRIKCIKPLMQFSTTLTSDTAHRMW